MPAGKTFQSLTEEEIERKSKRITWSPDGSKKFHIFAAEFQVGKNNLPSPKQVIILMDRLDAPPGKFSMKAYAIIVKKALDALNYRLLKGEMAIAKDELDGVEYFKWSEAWLLPDWNGNLNLPRPLPTGALDIRPTIPRRHSLSQARLVSATVDACRAMLESNAAQLADDPHTKIVNQNAEQDQLHHKSSPETLRLKAQAEERADDDRFFRELLNTKYGPPPTFKRSSTTRQSRSQPSGATAEEDMPRASVEFSNTSAPCTTPKHSKDPDNEDDDPNPAPLSPSPSLPSSTRAVISGPLASPSPVQMLPAKCHPKKVTFDLPSPPPDQQDHTLEDLLRDPAAARGPRLRRFPNTSRGRQDSPKDSGAAAGASRFNRLFDRLQHNKQSAQNGSWDNISGAGSGADCNQLGESDSSKSSEEYVNDDETEEDEGDGDSDGEYETDGGESDTSEDARDFLLGLL